MMDILSIMFCIVIIIGLIALVVTLLLMGWSIFEDTELGQIIIERIKERREE